MCTSCGASFRRRDRFGCAMIGAKDKACPGKCRVQEQMHISHDGHTAETVNGTKIVFCSGCGAYGTTKAVLLKLRCEPQTKERRMVQWNAINTKHVHPTTNVPLVNYKRVPRRSGMFGTPPQCHPTAEGAVIPGSHEPPTRAAGTGLVLGPQAGALEGSFSSKEGWELYKAVRKAANDAGEGTSSSRLRSEATV